jgi:hypothetical protein
MAMGTRFILRADEMLTAFVKFELVSLGRASKTG